MSGSGINVGCIVELTKITPAGGDELLSRQADLLREQLGSALRIIDQIKGSPDVRAPDQQVDEREVRSLLKLRRNRDLFFDSDLFADPAWDILLELYAASLGQYRVSVTSLCCGAAVPATTALRWIALLEARGLIIRRSDPIDGRRTFLMLSKDGLDSMGVYFRTVPAGAAII